MYAILCIATVALNAFAANGNTDIERKFDLLFNHVEVLNAKIEGLKTDFATREQTLLAEISDLRSKCSACGSGEMVEGGSTKRAVSQIPVAFYAIAPKYDFSVMGVNQSLVYQTPFLNVGNAFRSSTGTFIAPVRGIYVMFVTVGGNIHNSNYFYVDVSGTRMAHVLLTANGPTQSSQSIVVSLKPGDTVSVRAGRYKDGAYGEYFTTIGGFLLSENARPSVVGK